jgi:serine protease
MRAFIAGITVLAALALAGPASAAVNCNPGGYTSGGSPNTAGPVNDPLFPQQWGLQQIKAPAAWARGDKGAGAVIGVVDTGADLNHPDLQGKLVAGTDLVPGGGDCPGAQDENGHGTHVSGIAAAATNNGIGVAGTAPDAKVMPVRVLDASGSGDDATVISGIKYAADHGAKVINLSLGGSPIVGELPQANAEMAAAVKYAFTKGSLVVAAAGNESLPLCSYPAAAQYAVCVGATDSRGAPSFYSNFPNSPEPNVGVRAPGGVGSVLCEDSEDIWSTIWPGDSSDCQGNGAQTGYDTLAGTSMASPFVSGLSAILSAKGLSNAQIMECLKDTSSNKGAFDPVMGYGIIDADSATSSCSATRTAAFAPTGGVGGGSSSNGDYLTVTVKRTTAKKLARKRKLLVKISSGKNRKVKLRAVYSKSRKSKARTLAVKTVKVRGGKQYRTYLRISKKKARALGRYRKASIKVLYNGGDRKGTATSG